MIEQNFLWKHNRRFNDYSSYCKRTFNKRMQKISINAGFTCPNRDGTKSSDGCIYCYNKSFTPNYCEPEISITDQLNTGIDFFSKKYKDIGYFAYFQSYTNTYKSNDILIDYYTEALKREEVKGLIIATRPDCLNDYILDFFKELKKEYYITIELGVESTSNKTLTFINRQHTFEESINAIEQVHNKGINVGAHMIIGLPYEDEKIIYSHAEKLSKLPLHTLKLHQLQIIKDTKLHEHYLNSPSLFPQFSYQEYIELIINFIEKLDPSIIIERFISESPRDLLICPRWGLKNFEIVDMIDKRLMDRDTWQGKLH